MKEQQSGKNRRWVRALGLSGIVLSAAVLAISLLSTSSTHAQGPQVPGPQTIDPSLVAYGRTYSEWSAAWEQWADSIPTANHPLFDNGPISVGQSGPVWFLGGKFCANGATNCGTSNVVRFGSVPFGKALYVAVYNSEDSTLEDPSHPQINDLRIFNQGSVDPTTVSMEVDGFPIIALKGRFRVQSPAFVFTLPQDNFFTAVGEGPFNAGSYFPGVDDGVFVMLAPMSPGLHTIHFHATNPNFNFTLDITYHLRVEKQ